MTRSMKLETVTPEKARDWLDRLNTRNYRPMNWGHVARVAAQMRAGTWSDTHEAVAFDDEGLLGDGQHRLEAISRSGVTVEIFVGRGVERKAFANINKGLARTAGDRLRFEGLFLGALEVSHAKAAACAKATITRFNRSHHVEEELLVAEAADKEDAISAIVRSMEGGRFNCEVAAAFVVADRLALAPRDELVALSRKFATGLDLPSESDPIRRLWKAVESNRLSRSKLVRGEIYALSVSAIKAAVTGRSLAKLFASEKDFDGTPSPNALRAGVERKASP